MEKEPAGIQGISLIDASMPRACSIGFCNVARLSVADVLAARADWPAYRARRKAEHETAPARDS